MRDAVRKGADSETFVVSVERFAVEDAESEEEFVFIQGTRHFLVEKELAKSVYDSAGRGSQKHLGPREWNDKFVRALFRELVEYGRHTHGIDYGAVIPNNAAQIANSSRFDTTIEAELWLHTSVNITFSTEGTIRSY